mmetsp:Transcript_97671/g.280613  ORF Transcript_97671/g.280613 Transcript_97671/m.280613 type:complete len:274 (+) Transcript_97671:796-1617(+)
MRSHHGGRLKRQGEARGALHEQSQDVVLVVVSPRQGRTRGRAVLVRPHKEPGHQPEQRKAHVARLVTIRGGKAVVEPKAADRVRVARALHVQRGQRQLPREQWVEGVDHSEVEVPAVHAGPCLWQQLGIDFLRQSLKALPSLEARRVVRVIHDAQPPHRQTLGSRLPEPRRGSLGLQQDDAVSGLHERLSDAPHRELVAGGAHEFGVDQNLERRPERSYRQGSSSHRWQPSRRGAEARLGAPTMDHRVERAGAQKVERLVGDPAEPSAQGGAA